MVFTIKKRRALKISIPTGFLFTLITYFTVTTYFNIQKQKTDETKKFLGDYKLLRLDRDDCESCKVRLYDTYRYDILVKDKVVGHGNWDIETAIDIPGVFLKIENGSRGVIWEKDRVVDQIDRPINR